MKRMKGWILPAGIAVAALGAAAAVGYSTLRAEAPNVTVYKSPSCGCCGKWVDHLKANGFEVAVVDQDDLTAVKANHGVAADLTSCHTAVVEGYVIEGHVPADLIHRMLEERLAIVGLAVPGMPAGSPGMEGSTPQPYDVIAFDTAGNRTIYSSR